MDCGSNGFHDGDEKSTRTYASVVRGEDSSAPNPPMTNLWWRKLQLENEDEAIALATRNSIGDLVKVDVIH